MYDDYTTDSFDTYELAGIGSRFFALFLDNVFIGIIAMILGVFIGFDGGLFFLLISLAYQWYFLTRNDGRTPGKHLLGIRVISLDGNPISDRSAVFRFLGYWLNSVFGGILWLWAVFDDKKQGLHDKFAQTVVVSDRINPNVVYIQNDIPSSKSKSKRY